LEKEGDSVSDSNHSSNKVTLNELVRRRTDLIFEINELQDELARKRDVVFHITETIKAIDPKVKLEALPARHRRGTKSPYFAHGEITGYIYDAGRESEDHVFTSNAVATLAMRSKSLDPRRNQLEFKDFESRIRLQLNALRREKIVEKLDGRGGEARWRLLRN
jgi:hypothetical protein